MLYKYMENSKDKKGGLNPSYVTGLCEGGR